MQPESNRISTFILAGLLMLSLSGLVPVAADATTGGQSGAFTRIGLSPRTIALGNAYVAGGQDGQYALYNPASAARITHNQIDMGSALMSFDRRFATLQATFPLPPNAGLSFDITYAGVSGIDGRTQSGYHTEMLSTHEIQAGASFGLSLNERMSVGIRVSFQTAQYHSDVNRPVSVGFDLGAQYRLTEHTTIGFVAKDLLAEYVWDTSELYGTAGSLQTTDEMPVRLIGGISHSFKTLPATVYAAFENRLIGAQQFSSVTQLEIGRPVVRTRRDNITYARQYIMLGGSYAVHERLVMRAGWQSGDTTLLGEQNRISAGFSLKLPFDLYSPAIDYAVVREPGGISWMHMLSIRLNINQRE